MDKKRYQWPRGLCSEDIPQRAQEAAQESRAIRSMVSGDMVPVSAFLDKKGRPQRVPNRMVRRLHLQK